ncbi:hypothetical protein [Thermocrinis minervae]|uniref:Uncharacterized protein n=1 Tax=Thermocrinis minervae TaxID=381751 RepID=A0A1M6TEI7_9AQUI|nr:hypothetical protein [Thermocrinis minervae]SHK55415.1 hypothetical protein SAMN05444391_1430 [Thermocrinis minervae]
MEKLRCMLVDFEGNTKEISRALREVLEGIEGEGGRIVNVRAVFVKEHGLDGYNILFEILYTSTKELEEA